MRWTIASAMILLGCAGPARPSAEPTPVAKAQATGERPAMSGLRALEEAKQHARSERFSEAIAACQRSITADPANEEAYLLLASLGEMTNDEKLTAEALTRGLEKLPSSSELLHAKGMSALEHGDPKGAVQSLEAARRNAGGRPKIELLADLAYAYLFTEQLEEAEALARQCRSLDPQAYAPAFTHGEALLRLKRYPEAADAYRAASSLAPKDPLPLSRLATALMKAGAPLDASPVLLKLLELGSDRPAGIHAALAQAKLQLGLNSEAVHHAQEATRLDPKERAYRELLAKAVEAQKSGAKGTKKGPKARGDKDR